MMKKIAMISMLFTMSVCNAADEIEVSPELVSAYYLVSIEATMVENGRAEVEEAVGKGETDVAALLSKGISGNTSVSAKELGHSLYRVTFLQHGELVCIDIFFRFEATQKSEYERLCPEPYGRLKSGEVSLKAHKNMKDLFDTLSGVVKPKSPSYSDCKTPVYSLNRPFSEDLIAGGGLASQARAASVTGASSQSKGT